MLHNRNKKTSSKIPKKYTRNESRKRKFKTSDETSDKNTGPPPLKRKYSDSPEIVPLVNSQNPPSTHAPENFLVRHKIKPLCIFILLIIILTVGIIFALKTNVYTEKDYVWYFSYGSNMKESTMVRRNIKFTKHVRGYLKEYKTTFTHKGWVPMEPCFANIEKVTSSNDLKSHGIAYLIKRSDLLRLDDMEFGYDRIEVELTLLVEDKHLLSTYETNSAGKLVVSAYKSQPDYEVSNGKPSPRYLNLIVTALSESGFDKSVVFKMASTPTTPWLEPNFEILENIQKNIKNNVNKISREQFCDLNHYYTVILNTVFDIENLPIGHRNQYARGSMTTWARKLWNAQNSSDSPPPPYLGYKVTYLNLPHDEQSYLWCSLKWIENNYPFIGYIEEPINCFQKS